jgi:hypothetical protein
MPLVSVVASKVGPGNIYTREPFVVVCAGQRSYTFSWNKDDTVFVEVKDMASVTAQVQALSGGTITVRPE